MPSYRHARIPTDYSAAEFSAFPLSSAESLKYCITRIDPEFRDAESEILWRAAEATLHGALPAMSLDEIVAIRDSIWFGNSRLDDTIDTRDLKKSIPLHRYVRRLADRHLQLDGTHLVPRLAADWPLMGNKAIARHALARHAWWWLSLAMPSDLLEASSSASDQGRRRVRTVSPNIERLLADSGFAEVHVHLGACLSFYASWVSAQLACISPEFQADAFRSPGAAMEEGKRLAHWILCVAITRLILAAFLRRRSTSETLRSFLDNIVTHQVETMGGVGDVFTLRQALERLCSGDISAFAQEQEGSFARLQRLFRLLTGLRKLPTFRTPEEVCNADPLAIFYPSLSPAATPDHRFFAAAYDYLENCEAPYRRRDSLFESLYWQHIRVRTIFHRHIVQRPMTPGLQWFIRFFARLAPLKTLITKEARARTAAQLCGAGKGLKSLEVRIGFCSTAAEIKKDVDQIVAGVRNVSRNAISHSDTNPPLELGVVLHLSKIRGGGSDRGVPHARGIDTHANPDTSNQVYRFAHYFTARNREVQALNNLIRQYPLSLLIIRGIDVCTDELAVPSWVFSGMFASMRRASHLACGMARAHFDRDIPGLRTTVHAGEDFVHLLTGLRHLDECIKHLRLAEGDRIGHAMAIGVNAEDWVTRAGRIPIKEEVRLFDLLWLWKRCNPRGAPKRGCVVPGLERELNERIEAVFGHRRYSIATLAEMTKNLAAPRFLRAIGFPRGRPFSWCEMSRAAVEWLTSPTVFERGGQIVWIDPRGEGELLVAMQRYIREQMSSRGLAVEINPTSNLLIRDLGDLTEHPMWRMRPPRGSLDFTPVTVCVGSDDPITFASDLMQEYQRLADAMTMAGLSDEEARQWLERTRASGLDSRFTCDSLAIDVFSPAYWIPIHSFRQFNSFD